MVFLRHMAYPSRFGDLVNEFNIPSNRLCEIFHATLDWIFVKFAYRLLQPQLYCGYFTMFAFVLNNFGSPIPFLIGIIDGNFIDICRPMGLRNFKANVDLQEFYYSCKEKSHGLKFLAVLFPNGMICRVWPRVW